MTDTHIRSARRIRHPLVDGCAPEWASGWGQDAFGIFAEHAAAGPEAPKARIDGACERYREGEIDDTLTIDLRWGFD